MKRIIKYVTGMLACWAEFGAQHCIPGLTAATSLNNHQYGVVRLSAAGKVNICSETLTTTAANGPLGVLQNKPYVNEAATVAYFGLSKAIGGGTVTAGSPISADSSGHVVNAVSGGVVIGRALETATTAGEIVTTLLMPPVRWGSMA